MSTTAIEKNKPQDLPISEATANYLKNLPPPVDKENYVKITENFLSQNFLEMTSQVKDVKSAFDAINSIRTLDCKLAYIILLMPQFQNDALRHLDNITNLYRQLNVFVSEEKKQELKLDVNYAENHGPKVVEYLVDLRVAFILHQMASIYYQRELYPYAAQLFMRSSQVVKVSEEVKKEIDTIPESDLTEDEKFDLGSKFTEYVRVNEYEGLHMAGLTYRILASTEDYYSDKQKGKIFESAIKLQEEALKTIEKIPDSEAQKRAIAQAKFELGVNSLLLEKDEALKYFDECLEQTEDELIIENCNFHKILYYRSKDNIEKSLECFEKLKFNKNGILLSSIYMAAKDYEKAVEVIEKELKEKEAAEQKDLEDYSNLFQLYQQLAQIHIVKKRVSDAMEAAMKAESFLNNELKDKVSPTVVEKQQDIFKAIYVEQQQYGKVLSYCIRSLAAPEIQDKVSEKEIEDILPQFAIQSKKSLLFLTETVEPESASFYVFLLTPTGKLYFARSPTEVSIEGYAQKALQSLSEEGKSTTAKQEADEVLSEMYKHFISPIKEHIPQDVPLAIVTHLFQIHALTIPFSALRNPETGKHLAEEYTVELAPLQFIEQIEKIQETKAAPTPNIVSHPKPQFVLVAPDKNSAEVKRMQKLLSAKKLPYEEVLLAKPKKKAVLKELKSNPSLMFFLTGDNLEGENKEAPIQFGLTLNRSEILIPKDDLKNNYAPVTTMPKTCIFGHVSGTFAFCQYAHYFLKSGADNVVGFKMIVREKHDDKILLNEEIYPRFIESYFANGEDASKAYKDVLAYLIEKHNRLTWSSFALVSRVNPLPRKV